MKIAYDMHIHSALSPCGDNDMTPNNIVNMAFIKGLRLISITDHNTMANVLPIIEVAKKYDILVVPGIEVTSREDIHVLCYFSSVSEGLEFQELIYDSLPDIDNNEELFGSQLIFDHNDIVTGSLKKMLISSSKYSLEHIDKLVKRYNGVMVPAHVDKSAYSIISSLGFIPDSLEIYTIEVYNENKIDELSSVIDKNKYRVINNSDAHYLTDIQEALSFLYLNSLTTESVLNYLKGLEEYTLKELSLHILDLAENSIKAKASIIKISIKEDFKEDLLSINVEDNGLGMNEEFLKVADDPFITTRTTRSVGLGLSLMKAATFRCEGNFSIDSIKGNGTRVISTFKHSHIDRSPIGNMGQTIVSLINHDDTIEYIYTHDINGDSFVFDTREIKKILGEVSISNNEILLWISEYINSNINNLYEI